MFRYKYSLLIIFNIIALQSCLLVNDGRYISESLPYRLELTVSRKLSESNIAWGTVIHDPLKNEDIIIKLENIYTSKDGYFFESVLDIFNPDLKLLRRIIFHSFDYPLLRGVRVLPYTEDINKNGSSDLFILLQYNDSTVIGCYDLNLPCNQNWLSRYSINTKDYQSLSPLTFWKYPVTNDLLFVFKKSNTRSGINIVADTLYFYNLTKNNIDVQKPIGAALESLPNKIQTDSILILPSYNQQNFIPFDGFDDYHSYVLAINVKGKIIWADTVSKQERYSINDITENIALLFDNKVIISKRFYNDDKSYYTKILVCRINDGKILNENVKSNSMQMENILDLGNKKCIKLYDNVYNKICLLDSTLQPIIQNGYNVSFLKSQGINYRLSFHNLLFTYDINKDGTNDFITSNSVGQVVCIDGKNLEPLFASEPQDIEGITSFFIDSNGNPKLLVVYAGSFNIYSIHPMPFFSRLGAYKYELLAFFVVLLILPVGVWSIRKIKTFQILIQSLSSKSDTQCIIVLNRFGKIIFINPLARELMQSDKKIKHLQIKSLPEDIRSLFYEFLEDKKEIYREFHLGTNNSRYFLTNISSIKPFLNSSLIIIVMNDVTKVVNEERRRETLKTALMVAHGIKTPLGTAQLQFDELMSFLKTQRIQEEEVLKISEDIISQSIAESADIIRRISYLVKDTTTTSLQLVSFDTFINEWLQKYSKRYSNRGVKMENHINNAMPFLLINPLSFDLLLQCACDNSVEAMSYKQTDKLIIFDAIIDKDKLTFIIEDNGSGINPDIISQILNVSGFSTKRTGSGLGFQLIQKAADEHKAEIVIDSDPGSYTKLQFIFKLKGEDRATQ